MQQNDDILPQESAGASTPVAQGDTPTIQPVANARPRNGRSLSIAAPGQTASVGEGTNYDGINIATDFFTFIIKIDCSWSCLR